MNTLTVSAIPFTNSKSQFSSPIFLLPFSHRCPKFFHFPPSKSFTFIRPYAAIINTSTSTNDDDRDANNSLSFGGWDDLGFGGELVNSGESTQIPGFLVSIGIDSKKYIFVFLFGIFCALAVSRVRVSSVILFPASVLIFGVGFSLGFFRGGSFNEFSSSSSKKRVKDEIFRANGEKLKTLVEYFDGLDVKINDLKRNIERAIDNKEIELDDLENYVGVIDSIQAFALNSRNVVENTIDVGNCTTSVLVENQKSSSKKKKEIKEAGSELLQFVGGLFGEKLVDRKPTKAQAKDNVKQGAVQGSSNDGNNMGLADDQTRVNGPTQQIKLNGVNNDKGTKTFMFSQGSTNKSSLDWDSQRRIRIVSGNAKLNMGEVGGDGKQFVDDRHCSYQCSGLQFMDNQSVSWKTNQSNESEMWKSNENLRDSMDFNFTFEHMETQASIVQEQTLKQSSGAYKSLNSNVNEDETYRSRFREEGTNNDSCSADCQPTMEGEVGSSSSQMFADDMMFDRYLSEANSLIKQAKEYIRGKHDEELAETILYKSAKLLSKALAMKPVSLLAVGLLGNTYLLLGELKLKTSRELRTLLSRRDPLSVKSRANILRHLDKQELDKAKIASVLVNVCEECEDLLVEAGRKYRLALSIDGNDVRALYNWGLALSFRAQLIADIGPEAAFDADKVFLAAIDKFNAIMSKGNVYAPDALYRWGVVLQQRSRLRTRNSKEKLKLLMQAKRLYEDALNMDSQNVQVREAILSCVDELNHWQL